MSKKYLSLEEAAHALGITTDELKRLREKGDIRGFADRSTWKFRDQDVEEYRRRRSPDSTPDVPIISDDIGLGDEPTLRDDSASDVRLILDDGLLGNDSDPDAPTVGHSDVLLSDPTEMGSSIGPGSDSDVKLVGDGSSVEIGISSDSDVRLVDPDAGASNVLDDEGGDRIEEGLTLSAGSSILGGEDSGISLEAADSGISLEAADSGISLESLDSGINLSQDSTGDFKLGDDSGISLSKDPDSGTMSMDSLGDESDLDDTRYELDTAGSSEYEITGLGEGDDAEDTSVLLLDDDDQSSSASPTMVGRGKAQPEEESFDVGDDAGEFDDFEASDETVAGDDDELDDLDVFDAVDEDFDDDFDSGSSAGEFAAPVGMRMPAAAEPEWGTGTFLGVLLSSILMLVCGLMMIDLVRGMWSYQQPTPYNSVLLDMFKGMMQ